MLSISQKSESESFDGIVFTLYVLLESLFTPLCAEGGKDSICLHRDLMVW